MTFDGLSVHKAATKLVGGLRNIAVTTAQRESLLFELNACMFEHSIDAQVCFIIHEDGSIPAGIAAFIGPHGMDGIRRFSLFIKHMSEIVAFSSPVEGNTHRIEVFKNRFEHTGFYESRAALAEKLGIKLTMRLPR